MISLRRAPVNRVLLVAILVVLLILTITTFVSAQDDGSNQVYACVNKESRLARFGSLDEACRNNEYPLNWNIVGPQGPQGIPGENLIFGQWCPAQHVMVGVDETGQIICAALNLQSGTFDWDGDPSGPPEPQPAVCGNGIVEPPEVCDDGNTVDGDGCSSTCSEAVICPGACTPGEAGCNPGDCWICTDPDPNACLPPP